MDHLNTIKRNRTHYRRFFLASSIILALIMLFLCFNTAIAETIIYQENFSVDDLQYYLDLGWSRDYVGGNYVGVCNTPETCYYKTAEYSWVVSNWAVAGYTAHSTTNVNVNFVEFYFKSTPIDTEIKSFDIEILGKSIATGQQAIIVNLSGQTTNRLAWQNVVPYWFDLGEFRNVSQEWNYLRVEVDKNSKKFRLKFNEGNYTLWQDSYTNFSFDYLSRFYLRNGNNTFWIEEFKIGNVAEFYSECGPGNYLQFCDTEETCEAKGGYWYNDFCYEEQIDILECGSYYEEHSDFDNPTDFYNSLCSFITPFIQSIGNFLETFKKNFVISQATEKGYLLGSAISQARGYLDLINNFFGGLPISEMLLLYIIVSILVIVVRLVLKIIGVIKP